jgi:hypothetical protein
MKGISGPPGTRIEFRGSGFNPLSAQGNIAIFQSAVDGSTVEVPGVVRPDTTNPTLQVFEVLVPPLTAGAATITLQNKNTGDTSAPITLTVTASAPLSRPAAEIIDDFFVNTLPIIETLPAETPEQEARRAALVANYSELQKRFSELAADTSPEVQQTLDNIAIMLSNAPDLSAELAASTAQGCYTEENRRIAKRAIGYGAAITAVLCGLGGLANPVGGVICGGFFAIAYLELNFFVDDTPDCNNDTPPECTPTQPGTGSNSALQGAAPQQTGSSTMVGMGSAPPPGGNGCGNLGAPPAGGDGDNGLQQIGPDFDPTRYTIKVYPRGQTSGAGLSQFTGALDAGGYFFVPFIPEGEPYTAAAYDNVSGRVETFEGIGPPLGESTLMFFDFSGEAEAEQVYPISIGDKVSNGVPEEGAGNIELPGGSDVYTFTADPRQYVLFEIEEIDTSLGRERTTWKLEDERGATVFDAVFASDRDIGPLLLMPGGTYTLTVQANEEALGAYRFTLLDFPQQDRFDIALNDEISDGVPAAGAGNIETSGAKDIYFFVATAGQHIFIDVQAWDTPQRTGQQWDLVAPDGTLLIDRSGLSEGGQRGPITLEQTGTYAVIVGTRRSGDATGTYRIQVWEVPPPDVFTISIGDTISDGVPGPGAGNLETPGVQDIYTFAGSSGQQVFFESLEAVPAQQWNLAAPDGALLEEARSVGFDRGPITLPETGTYTLTVLPAINDDVTGSYRFTLWEVPPPDVFAISIGDTVADGVPGPGAGNVESPGVQDIYTFAGSSGQAIFFNLLEGDFLSWNLVAPDGTVMHEGGFVSSVHEGPIPLPETGTYTLTVGVREDSDVVSRYSFKLWNVPPPDEFAISIGDTVADGVPGPGAGNIESPGVRDIYTFAGSSGQQITFTVLEPNGQNWDLVAPDGTLLVDRSAFTNRGPITLPQTGTYTLIAGTRANLPVTGTYRFQLTSP